MKKKMFFLAVTMAFTLNTSCVGTALVFLGTGAGFLFAAP